MQEVFEKIIEKLEEQKKGNPFVYGKNDKSRDASVSRQTLDYAIEIVKQEAEKFGTDTNVGSNGWISCSERLPEKYNRVLAYTDAGGYYIAHVNGCGKFVCTAECVSTVIENSDVIVWQPLPQPYQPKGE